MFGFASSKIRDTRLHTSHVVVDIFVAGYSALKPQQKSNIMEDMVWSSAWFSRLHNDRSGTGNRICSDLMSQRLLATLEPCPNSLQNTHSSNIPDSQSPFSNDNKDSVCPTVTISYLTLASGVPTRHCSHQERTHRTQPPLHVHTFHCKPMPRNRRKKCYIKPMY